MGRVRIGDSAAFIRPANERKYSRLKTTAQLIGMFPPDPELTRPTQELFEQFWRAHGYPNEAEMDLLEGVGYVDAATVDAWC